MKPFLIVLALIAGCATVNTTIGRDFNDSAIPRIVKGKTTVEELNKMMGQPYQKTVIGISEIWVYQYLKSTGHATSVLFTTNSSVTVYQKTLTVIFDSLHIAQLVSYTTSGNP